MANREQRVELRPGERVVGYLSQIRGQDSMHLDFQFVLMADILGDELQACECFHSVAARALPGLQTRGANLKKLLYQDINQFEQAIS